MARDVVDPYDAGLADIVFRLGSKEDIFLSSELLSPRTPQIDGWAQHT